MLHVQAGTLRVLVVDDHPLMMRGIAAGLADYQIDVIGQFRSGREMLAQYQALKPDVALLDIRFDEGLSGLDIAQQLLEQCVGARIVFFSQVDQISLIREAYRLGAKAFITKDCDAPDLAAAIKAAAKGESFLLPGVAQRLANMAIQGDESPQSLLEPREMYVFTLMAEGVTNVEMAEKLNLSPRTISHISQTVKEKLAVYRPADVTRLAVKYGLMEP